MGTDSQGAQNEEALRRTRKAGRKADADEILPEYDFSGAARNKYAAGNAVVVLEPDVAPVFPTSREANEVLRALAGITEKQRARYRAFSDIPSSHVLQPESMP